MNPTAKTVRFGLVALLVAVAPCAASGQTQGADAPTAHDAAPTADAASGDAEDAGDIEPEAALEDDVDDGPPPEDQFEPPFLGFYFGFGGGTAVDLQPDSHDLCSEFAGCKARSGYGLDFAIGARFSPMFKLQGAYDVFWHQGRAGELDSVAMLQSWRMDGRLTFPLESNYEPFVQVGLGFYAFGDEFAVDTAGPGLQAGGGVDLALSRWWSVALAVLYRGFRLDSTDPALGAQSAITVHSVTAMLGLSFGPGI